MQAGKASRAATTSTSARATRTGAKGPTRCVSTLQGATGAGVRRAIPTMVPTCVKVRVCQQGVGVSRYSRVNKVSWYNRVNKVWVCQGRSVSTRCGCVKVRVCQQGVGINKVWVYEGTSVSTKYYCLKVRVCQQNTSV